MKVTSIRLEPETLKILEKVSENLSQDLTTTIRQTIRVGLDVSEKTSKFPLEQIPQNWRSPELLFLSEGMRNLFKN